MTEDARSGLVIYREGLAQLNQELGRPIAIDVTDAEAGKLTPEGARELLAWLRKQVEEGVI